MEDLGKASLRPRHWKQLSRSAGISINFTTESLIRMNLRQFINLGLQNHVDDVRNIVKRASKDIYIENMLKLYEEVWLSKVFETRKHTRLTSVSAGGFLPANDSVSVIKFSLPKFVIKDRYKISSSNFSIKFRLPISLRNVVEKFCHQTSTSQFATRFRNPTFTINFPRMSVNSFIIHRPLKFLVHGVFNHYKVEIEHIEEFCVFY